jgi:Kef-type K+ transport system membrane component KefB
MSKLSQYEVMSLLIQLSVMLLMGRLFAEAARKLKQPAVIGEILAGIILGSNHFGYAKPRLVSRAFSQRIIGFGVRWICAGGCSDVAFYCRA